MEEAIKQITEENPELNDTALPSPNGSQTGLQETITTKQEDLNSQPTKKILDLFEEALEKSENYQSGFWNGYFELSKDSLETYLSQKTILNNTKEELILQEKNLQEINHQIDTNKNQYNHLFAELTQINYQLDYQINLKKRRENDLAETDGEIERYKQEREDLRNKNSFLGGVLFLLAAVVFILGDLIISHEIVAYALNIKNTTEAWSFAVGLAMVSVLLKPAYDRLIEYPYSQDKTLRSKRVYLIFKILVVVFTILTLGILGYFRYEAYRADQLKNNINSNIIALQEEENPESLKLIESLTKKSETLSQNLVNSDSGMWAFVLSGVLFAIAGAICLGIAFPVLVAYVRIWFQIPRKIKKLEKSYQAQIKAIEEIEMLISQQSAKLEAQKNLIHHLGNFDALTEKKIQLEKRILELKQKAHKTETEIQITELTMGYEKGKKAFEMEIEERKKELEEKKKEKGERKKETMGSERLSMLAVSEAELNNEQEVISNEQEVIETKKATEPSIINETSKISSKVLSKIKKI
jgi:hypothetical protein